MVPEASRRPMNSLKECIFTSVSTSITIFTFIAMFASTQTLTAGETGLQEGELRPQLLDRFGMSVNVTTLLDVDLRTQMVLDKMAYEQVRLSHHALMSHTWLTLTDSIFCYGAWGPEHY